MKSLGALVSLSGPPCQPSARLSRQGSTTLSRRGAPREFSEENLIKLSCFPKCYMDPLVIDRTMTLFDWIDIAATLDIDGVELYPGFFESFEPDYLDRVRNALEQARLQMPMFCSSPDFTIPDRQKRLQEVERHKKMMDVTASLGGRFLRTLSGQRYPDVSHEDGVKWVVECLNLLLEHAEKTDVVMTMENHYKDNYWTYPEFAQKLDVFLEIINKIDSPYFKVNFDASNSIIAGEDPITVLNSVKHRVATMHASDRYLKDGKLVHGITGGGMVDYNRVFEILKEIKFDGWISIEDGVNGLDELKESIAFVKGMIKKIAPEG